MLGFRARRGAWMPLQQTQRELASVLAGIGLTSEAETFGSASLRDARWLARDVARSLNGRDPSGQLPYAFAAFALAVKNSEPGLEDIAMRNLLSARRFAGLTALD